MDDLYAVEPEQPEPSLALPDELNGPQATAVAHAEGPLLIFAGAGSGKTRVIVYRIANLIAAHRVPPYRILAVTFTNKAAGEMRARLGSLLGEAITKDIWVGTFHATCMKILRRNHEAAGLQRGFVIYDDGDQRSLMNRILKELGLDEKRYPPRQVLSRIHASKQEGKRAADYVPESYMDDAIAKCFTAYERHLEQANAIDFDDILILVLRIVEDKESPVGAELRKRFRHVLVDEFQDVNRVQYRLVRALAGKLDDEPLDRPVNLCVVGDDDQSIYRWRGADITIVRGFRCDFPDATVVKLEQNYRSTKNIVQAALGVIKPAREREPKELWTDNRSGDPVSVIGAENEHDEAAFVTERIRELVRGGVSPRQIAVFYRTHAQSRVLEEVLRSQRVPYQIIGGMRFFERAEIKDCLSYLRVLENPKSDVDLQRIINVPSRKIGDTTVETLVRAADESGTSLYDAILPVCDAGAVGTAAKKALLGFHDLIQGLMRDAVEARPSEVLELVIQRTGYGAMLDADDSVESEARKLNLRELVGSVLDYEAEATAAGEAPALSNYLERVTLTADADTIEETPKVALMTVHAAKGLEFEAVFLTGMEENLFPFMSQEMGRTSDIEEERRLAYVAITRARRRLWITHASRRAIFGTTKYGMPSQFIRDIPQDTIQPGMTASLRDYRSERPQYSIPERTGPWVHPQERGDRDRDRARSSSPPPVSRTPGERYVERDDGGSDRGLARGAVVKHEKFGRGVVENVDDGDDPIVTVRFSGWGTKRIKARYLKM